ncbi:MAG: hypothetical protein PUG15_09630, partial [Bacteroidales bacterium]|nr:hypothetical protein [Bacteroidales bacterium]
VEVRNTGRFVQGLSTQFTMPGGLLDKDSDEDPWTFIVGTIKNYTAVTIAFGDISYEAYVVHLETALGELPTLVGRELFDTTNIAAGKIVGMKACIKVNFVQDKFPKP